MVRMRHICYICVYLPGLLHLCLEGNNHAVVNLQFSVSLVQYSTVQPSTVA